MDPSMFAVAGGISAIGQLLGGVTSMIGDDAKAKAYKNAGRQADAQAGVNAQIALQEGDAAAAHGAVQAAANGGGLTGSSLGVIQNLSDQAMFNARTQIYRGQTEAQADDYQAEVAQRQGLVSMIGSLPGAAGSLMGGIMKGSQMNQQQKAMSALQGGGYSGGGGMAQMIMGAMG